LKDFEIRFEAVNTKPASGTLKHVIYAVLLTCISCCDVSLLVVMCSHISTVAVLLG